MMSFQFDIDPKEEAGNDLVVHVGNELRSALIECKLHEGLTQKVLADRLGVHKSAINRHFSGYSNLTLKTLGEIAWGLDREVHVHVCAPDREVTVSAAKPVNYFEPNAESANRVTTTVYSRQPVCSKVSKVSVRSKQGAGVRATAVLGQ